MTRQIAESDMRAEGSPATAVLDRDILADLVGQVGQAAVARVVQAYLRDTPLAMAALLAAQRDGRGEELKELGHRLASSSAFVGASRLAALFREFERHAKNGEAASTARLVSDIEQGLHQVTGALQEAIGPLSGDHGPR